MTVSSVRHRLNGCADNVAARCSSRWQQLNGDKSEIARFGSRSAAGHTLPLAIGSDTIQLDGVVRDLRVWLDTEPILQQHIAKVTSVCYYRLRRLRLISRRIGQEVAARLELPSSPGLTKATRCSPAFQTTWSTNFSDFKTPQLV
jgi:hypothetical protein